MSKLVKKVGKVFGDVFGIGDRQKPPEPEPVAEMPDPENTRKAARRRNARRYAGASTILSNDTLGGAR